MNIVRIFLSLACFSTVMQSYTVQDQSPHVVIHMAAEKPSYHTCDDHSSNARLLVYHMTGLALGTTAYVITNSITHNLASQIIATVSLGALPPLFGIACEMYTCYKNK